MRDRHIQLAIASLTEKGHEVRPYNMEGKMFYEIADRRMLATPKEMNELGEGVYRLTELEELFVKRRLEEQGKL
ncbi:MAG: hypothetical protein WBL63_18430 [Candidatus Acidiferrum sp.]